ncbi:unnamed protein product [Boreogadus saida]
MRFLRLKPSYRTSNQLRVYQPRLLRLRNPPIQRRTCCLQLRPVASLQRRKSKRPLPLRRSLKGLWAARLEARFGWRSHPCRRCVDGPSVLFQWSQARRLGQLLFRPWSEVYRLARLASSLLAYEVHLCFILGRGPLRYPVPIALNHV